MSSSRCFTHGYLLLAATIMAFVLLLSRAGGVQAHNKRWSISPVLELAETDAQAAAPAFSNAHVNEITATNATGTPIPGPIRAFLPLIHRPLPAPTTTPTPTATRSATATTIPTPTPTPTMPPLTGVFQGLFSPPAVIAEDASFRAHVDLAVDAGAHVHVAYPRDDAIYYVTNASGTFGSATEISGAIQNAEQPSIAVDGSGKVHVAFSDGNAPYYVSGQGATFSTPLRIQGPSLSQPDGNAVIGLDRAGRVHMVYPAGAYGGDAIYYTVNSGSGFSVPVRIASNPGESFNSLDMAVDDLGAVHVVFGWFDLYYTNNVAGSFSTPVLALDREGRGALSMVVDRDRHAHIVAEKGGGGVEVPSLYTNNILGSFRPPSVLPGASFPTLDVDSTGAAHVAYAENGVTYARNWHGSFSPFALRWPDPQFDYNDPPSHWLRADRQGRVHLVYPMYESDQGTDLVYRISDFPLASTDMDALQRWAHPRVFAGPIAASSDQHDDPAGDVAVADFDRNGDLDLAITHELSPDINLYINYGIGTFGRPRGINEESGIADLVNDIVAADIDGDGSMDLVYASENGLFQVAGDEDTFAFNLNQDDGTFRPPTLVPVLDGTSRVIATDLNNDGRLDVVAGHLDNYSSVSEPDHISVVLNQGAAQFGPYRSYPTGARLREIYSVDISGDGYADLLAATLSGELTLLTNRQDGTFASDHMTLAPGLQMLAVGDLDRDGDFDLAALNTSADTVQLLLNDSSGVFTAGQVIASNAQLSGLVLADLNRDGRLDLVLSNYDEGSVSTYMGDGPAHFAAGVKCQTGGYPHHPFIADIDTNGAPDIGVVSHKGALMLLNRGDGTFETKQNYPVADKPQAMEAADLDGDGARDLVIMHSDDSLTVMGNDGAAGFVPRQRLSGAVITQNGGHPLAVTDLDDDGDTDVAAAFDKLIRILRNDGSGRLVDSPQDRIALPPVLQSTFVGIHGVVASDLDRDGDADLLVEASARDAPTGIAAYANDGAGHFGASTIALRLDAGADPVNFRAADVNGDNLDDIVLLIYDSTHNYRPIVILNYGNLSFSPAPAFSGDTDNGSFLVIDVDVDGDRDVLFNSRAFINDGTGQFPDDRRVADTEVAADLDQIGRDDFIYAYNWDQMIGVTLNPGLDRLDQSMSLRFPTDGRPVSPIVTDLDNDGYPDVATLNTGWFPGNLDPDAGTLTILRNGLSSSRPCTPYDLNGDRIIDIADIAVVASRWLDPATYDVRYDVAPPGAPDGVIDIADIAAVAVCFGQSCNA